MNNPTVDEVVNLWCEALESGRYEQGKKRLCYIEKNEPKYCCLGLLCEVAIQNGLPLNKRIEGEEYSLYKVAYYGENDSALLPKEVVKWAKLKNNGGDFYDGEKYNSLYSLNDSFGKSFKEIAEIIREHKTALFKQPN